MANKKKTKIFVFQDEIEKWVDSKFVDIKSSSLTIDGTEAKTSYTLEPAIYFEKQVAGESDTNNLLGSVLTQNEVKERGYEHFQHSVLINDCAYEVKEGFIIAGGGTVQKEAPRTMPQSQKAEKPHEKKVENHSKEEAETELLARLLLEKLR